MGENPPSDKPDEPLDLEPQERPQKSRDAIPSATRIDDPRRILEEVTAMSVQSGPHIAIDAFARLPESIQKQHLENDQQRNRMAFELESKHIEAELKERDAKRAHALTRQDRAIKVDDKNDTRQFWFIVGVVVLVAVVIGVLIERGKYDVATPMITAVLGLGAGFQGGKSSGYTRARREADRSKRDDAED